MARPEPGLPEPGLDDVAEADPDPVRTALRRDLEARGWSRAAATAVVTLLTETLRQVRPAVRDLGGPSGGRQEEGRFASVHHRLGGGRQDVAEAPVHAAVSLPFLGAVGGAFQKRVADRSERPTGESWLDSTLTAG